MFECKQNENTIYSMPWLCCTAAETICSNNTPFWTATRVARVLCRNSRHIFMWLESAMVWVNMRAAHTDGCVQCQPRAVRRPSYQPKQNMQKIEILFCLIILYKYLYFCGSKQTAIAFQQMLSVCLFNAERMHAMVFGPLDDGARNGTYFPSWKI